MPEQDFSRTRSNDLTGCLRIIFLALYDKFVYKSYRCFLKAFPKKVGIVVGVECFLVRINHFETLL